MKFKDVRNHCLRLWYSNTKRKRVGLDDKFHNSLECTWQRRRRKLGYDHVSIFCSIGDWSTNITDLLTDERFDDLDLTIDEDKEIIFRHFTKLALVISELLSDFEKIHNIATGKNDTNASRACLSKADNPKIVDRFMCYINHIFKHKTAGLHLCNHHIPFCFDDAGPDCCNENFISVDNATRDKRQIQ